MARRLFDTKPLPASIMTYTKEQHSLKFWPKYSNFDVDKKSLENVAIFILVLTC